MGVAMYVAEAEAEAIAVRDPSDIKKRQSKRSSLDRRLEVIDNNIKQYDRVAIKTNCYGREVGDID